MKISLKNEKILSRFLSPSVIQVLRTGTCVSLWKQDAQWGAQWGATVNGVEAATNETYVHIDTAGKEVAFTSHKGTLSVPGRGWVSALLVLLSAPDMLNRFHDKFGRCLIHEKTE